VADIASHGGLDRFRRDVTLDQLLADVKPITSLEELALDDLTAEEAASFLHSITE
jgi:hypothetical protein